MAEEQQPIVDQAGITRAPDGTIISPVPPETKTETPPETVKTETETKPESDTKPDGKSLLNQDDKDAPQGAPEKYEAFTLPEGFEADETAMGEAQTLFKELNVPQEGAQKLIDMYAKGLLEAREAGVKLWQETQDQWVKDIQADAEIGGKLKEVKSTISKAIDTLPEGLRAPFREAMDITGAGNNPAFVKAFWNMAQRLTEGRHVPGAAPSKFGQAAPGRPSGTGAGAMYPNLPSANSGGRR